MMRRLLVFAAVLSLASSAWANVFSITNDISLMTCTDRTFPVDRGYQFRLSVQALQGATPVSLSNRYVRFRLFDSRDGKAVVDKRATIVDEGESRFEVEADFAALQPGNYQAKSESWRVTNDTLAATLSCDVLQLSYSCSTCSAAYLSVTYTNVGGGSVTNVTGPNVEANSPGYFATGTPLYVVSSNTLSGVDGSGLTNLPSAPGSGAPQSPITNAVDYAGYSAVNMGYALINRMQIGQLSPYSSANTTAWSTVTNSWQGAVGGWIRSGTRGSVLAAGETNYLGLNVTDAAIVGGRRNGIDGSYSIIGGGEDHYITSGNDSIIGGGLANTSAAQFATISGGTKNRASGIAATVPGGATNIASGAGSFAAGRNATASGDGSFAWNSVQTNALTNATAQAVWFNAPGGARFYVGGTNYWEFLGTNLYCNGVLKL